MSDLADRECVPCKGGIPPLTPDEIAPLAQGVPAWRVVDDERIERTFAFPDFAGALAFVNQVGEIAEAANHHPDVHLSWGRVRVELWTHKIDGLAEADFVIAARIDRAFHPEPPPLVRLWQAPEPASAHLLAGYLIEEGITAQVRGESIFAGEGSVLPAEASPEIWVPASDHERAKQLIEEKQRRIAADTGTDGEDRDEQG